MDKIKPSANLIKILGIFILISLLCSCTDKTTQLNEDALAAMEKGDLDTAESLLENAIEAKPNVSELHANLAEVYHRKNDILKAFICINKAIELSQNPEVYYKPQLIYSIKAEKWDIAGKTLDILLKKDEKTPELMALKGVILLHEGNTNEAEKAFIECIEKKPKDCTSLIGLARIKIMQGDTQNAWNLASEVANQNNKDINTQADLAAVYTLIGKDTEASKILSNVAGQNYELHIQLANIYYRKKNWGLATSEYVKAQTLKPHLLEAQMGLAKVYYQTENLEKVLEITKSVLDKNPDLYEAMNLRGLAYLKRGQRYPAKQVLEESLKTNPDQPEITTVYEGIK